MAGNAFARMTSTTFRFLRDRPKRSRRTTDTYCCTLMEIALEKALQVSDVGVFCTLVCSASSAIRTFLSAAIRDVEKLKIFSKFQRNRGTSNTERYGGGS